MEARQVDALSRESALVRRENEKVLDQPGGVPRVGGAGGAAPVHGLRGAGPGESGVHGLVRKLPWTSSVEQNVTA